MRPDSKINYIFILVFIAGLIVGSVVFHKSIIPDQLTLTVTRIANDHDVYFKDQNDSTWVMAVENAFDGSFIPGTIIFFGKNEVNIK
jgi:hypothetical protein